ncbi:MULTISPECIES: response regulator [Cysteiniphilum]|uniref:DNA-binding response regulator n=1 Tax=Cysteiniphilum litorale TaxID=2056700 RepID=A0A8J3E881_9GAMM|nr:MULTISPECIES: response regulator transcription factor [Cysteiniphilum]GGF96576.1 DNA-binding response regulator [Cysteiniphilum litorale]
MTLTNSQVASIKNILIIDDDKEITKSLKQTLKGRFNIDALAIHHPKEAGATLTLKKFDAILLDLMLPEIDGIEVCRHIRTITNTPIVMITASQEVSERILAFDAGVDDFLVKPFSTLELMARINAIYRRMAQASPELKDKIYQFDRWQFDTRTSLLTTATEEVQLSTADANLLMVFLEHPRRILEREFLLNQTNTSKRDIYDRAIDVRVGLLRKKIEEDTKQPKLIQTHHGRGYVFNANVVKKAT